MISILKGLSAAAVISTLAISVSALAQSESSISGSLPNNIESPVRLAPVAGASSFNNKNSVDLGNFDKGFSAGVFADFGRGALNFETGILTLGASQSGTSTSTTVNVQNWGVPLLAKLNFSGQPHKTIFIKGGAMPFQTTGGDTNTTNIMGVAGVGADIPLGRFSALVLDASYNRLFTNNGGQTDYQGVALLGGLSFNL